MTKNAVIIGAGPAGISAAVYLIRAGFPVTVIYKDTGSLGKAHAIENYYGFSEPISGQDLFAAGLAQAKRLGAELIEDEAVGLVWEDKMTVLTQSGSKYPGDVIILAAGAARIAPKIKGLKDFEGRGVSYCAVCDAFFYRGKDAAVFGTGEYALHEARVLAATSREVTILTDGKAPSFAIPDDANNIRIDSRKIAGLEGDDVLSCVVFEDGTRLPISGFFVAVGVAGSADFARKIGAEVDGTRISVDENNATAIPGLYACGDAVGGMMQIAKAVYDGALAARHAIKYLKS